MKPVYILCLFLFSISAHAQKKLSFDKVSPMLNEAYAFAFSESDTDIFALTGGDDFLNYTSFLQIYDTRFDFWMGMEIKDLPMMNYSSVAYMKNYNGLLLLGGTQPYGTAIVKNEKIRMLNLDDYSVSELGVIPEAGRNVGLAADGNKVYFFGGSTGMETSRLGTRTMDYSKKLFVYDLAVGHLEMLADMPAARETNGGIVDGKLYVFGGYNGTMHSDVWQYDIEKDSWKTLAPLEKPIGAYALTQYKHYFILVGDYLNGNQILVYDTQKETAEYFKANFDVRQMGASIVGEQLFVYGGRVTPPHHYIKSEVYRISLTEIIKSLEQ